MGICMTFRQYEKLIEYLKKGPVLQLTVIQGADTGETLLLPEQGQNSAWKQSSLEDCFSEKPVLWESVLQEFKPECCPYRFPVGEQMVFAERVTEEAELVICGGGHVSAELSALADFMDYPYSVIDDREEFVGRDRFPNAKALYCGEFTEVLKTQEFSANASYIIVTRGHERDLECLDLILQKTYSYVGMIGSRAKVHRVMSALEEVGYPKEKLAEVHSPIGLKIGGQTPKEIAVSIIGELILCKNTALPMSILESGLVENIFSQKNFVMVRIIDKRGSAPRGVGSRMLVRKEGLICGTIGGGMVEYKAIERAKAMAESTETCVVETYGLNETSAAAIGMWCGGEVDVLFEKCER